MAAADQNWNAAGVPVWGKTRYAHRIICERAHGKSPSDDWGSAPLWSFAVHQQRAPAVGDSCPNRADQVLPGTAR